MLKQNLLESSRSWRNTFIRQLDYAAWAPFFSFNHVRTVYFLGHSFRISKSSNFTMLKQNLLESSRSWRNTFIRQLDYAAWAPFFSFNHVRTVYFLGHSFRISKSSNFTMLKQNLLESSREWRNTLIRQLNYAAWAVFFYSLAMYC